MKLLDEIKDLLDEEFAIVIDGPDHMVFNEHKSFNPASTIKLHILYAALKAMDEKKIHKDDWIKIPKEEIVPGAGVIHLLDMKGTTIHNLLTLMIAFSDNTATNMMLDILSIDYIQEIITSNHMKETFIRRKLYRMIPGVFNESSAHDLNHILHLIYEGIGISHEMSLYGLSIMKKQHYKNIGQHLRCCSTCNRLITDNTCTCGTYIGDVDPTMVEVYSKSGEITGHVHDACIMVINDQGIYVSILTSQQSNNKITQAKLGQIGLIVYKHYKEHLC